MEQETVQLVLSKLDEVVKLAGGKIGEFYPYAVRQQVIEGTLCIVEFVITATLVIVGGLLAHKYWKKIHGTNAETIVGLFLIFFVVFAFILSILSFSIGIPKLINPHFFAVKSLLEMVAE